MNPTILLIDDKTNWGTFISEGLNTEGFYVNWVKSKREAESLLSKSSEIEAVIVNLNLLDDGPVLDGQGYLILEYLMEHFPQLPRIAISALGGSENNNKEMAMKVGGLYSRYKVNYVAMKWDSNFLPELVHNLQELIKERKPNMEWETILKTVVSAITPYATVLGTGAISAAGSKVGEAVFDQIQKFWEWISENIESRGSDQDKKNWEDFKIEPTKHQDSLFQIILRLSPTEDITLRQTTQNLIQEMYRFLDNYDSFTLVDLKRICGRLNVHWENEVPNPTTEALARWITNYVQTRHQEQELVAAIFEINPDILPKKL
jgi:CheY-like chemotaxis protein